MRWTGHLLLLLMTLLGGGGAMETGRLQVGDVAPPILAETMRNGEFDLSELEGEVVLLQFWASWCQSCIAEMPNVAQLHAEFGESGLEIISISLDDEPKDARRAVSQQRMVWRQIVEGQGKESPLAKSYGVHGTPYFVLIGRDGGILAPVVKPSELAERVREAIASK